MKVVNTGNSYRVYDDTLKTFESFPAQTYKVCFSMQSGFYAEKYQDIENNEKIYGRQDRKRQGGIGVRKRRVRHARQKIAPEKHQGRRRS